MKTAAMRLPAMVTAGLLYGFYYDIHAAQAGTPGTPDGRRMAKVRISTQHFHISTDMLTHTRSGHMRKSIPTRLNIPTHSSKS